MNETKRTLVETCAVLALAGLWMVSFVRLGNSISREVVLPLMLSFTAAIIWGAAMGWVLARAYEELKRIVSEMRKHST